jgi:hypothetical protein
MKNNKKKYYLLIAIIITLSLFEIRELATGKNIPASLEENEMENAPLEGRYALQLTNKNSTDDTKEFAQLIQTSPSDTVNLYFANASGHDNSFLIKFFYNYEEVEFSVLSNSDFSFYTEYKLELPNNKEITLDIELAKSLVEGDKHAKLMVSVFAAPDKYEKNVQFMTDYYGMSTIYDMIFIEDPSFEPIIDSTFNIPETILSDQISDLNYGGILINTESNLDEYKKGVPFPPHNLKVKKGEDINLNYIVGDPTGGMDNRFVIISLLGWKQITMNDQLYFPVEIDPLKTSLGTFTIQAPNNDGLYEYVALMLPVRSSFATDGTMLEEADISSAYRFTIEVE